MTSRIIELPVLYNEPGICDRCGTTACMNPVIYNGKPMKMCWECIYRIQEGIE